LLWNLTTGLSLKWPELKVQPLIYQLHKQTLLHIGLEVVSAFWVALSELPGMRKQSEVSTRLGPRTVDSFYVDGRVVWGFTFRVMRELLGLTQGSSGQQRGWGETHAYETTHTAPREFAQV